MRKSKGESLNRVGSWKNMRRTEGGSSSLESLGSFCDCIIKNPRSTVARRNAQDSEAQGRNINDLNVFSAFAMEVLLDAPFSPCHQEIALVLVAQTTNLFIES